MPIGDWQHANDLGNLSYTCGHCGTSTGSNWGYWKNRVKGENKQYGNRSDIIVLCMRCENPTFFNEGKTSQVPAPQFGNEVNHLPDEVKAVYAEARNCMLVAAYTAASLMCRKILMNVAVAEGADPGKTFMEYIAFFKNKNYIPPKGDAWFEYIRKKGNEATHEIPQITREDAELTISFVQMILVMVYEFHGKLASQATGS